MRAALLALAASVALLGPTGAQDPNPGPPGGAWNDTDCHHPAEIPGDPKSGNCNPCIWGTETGDRNGTDTKIWTGGDMFPMVKPWYNGMSFEDKAPLGALKCSKCLDRSLDEFREMLASKPVGCDCTAGNYPSIPCNAPAPGLVTCDCYCAYATEIPKVCNIETAVIHYPGPCALARGRAAMKKQEFLLKCDFDGYFEVKQTGAGPTQHGGVGPLLGGEDGAAKAWCTDPSNGQQNHSSTVPAAQVDKLNCDPTVQCSLMNTFRCQRPEFHSKCWWLEDVGPWHGHMCVDKNSQNYEEAKAAVVAGFVATPAGKAFARNATRS